jgi:ABC-type branched-subunit amino acid transport system ATPase component
MGTDVTDEPAHVRARRGLARTFQSPVVPPELTVGDVADVARRAWKPYVEAGAVSAAGEMVGLQVSPEAVCERLGTLDRRRVLLACLLARRPSVVLLDEPCSGLLEDEIEQFVDIARTVVERLGVGMIIIEHRLEILFAVAQRVLVLHEGRQIAEGTPQEAFSNPAVRRAYFEGVAA